MNIQKILTAVLSLSAASALAAPTITVDRVQQRFPWNGCVDIDYTVSGMGADAVNYSLVLKASSAKRGLATVCSNFVGFARVDLPVENGAHRVTWDAKADGLVKFKADDCQVAAELYCDPVTMAEAQYMIIDVSGGTGAETYPVRYVRGELTKEDSRQFNQDLYKTDRIVLTKIKAGEFWMGVGKVDRKGNVNQAAFAGELTVEKTKAGDDTAPTYRQYVRLTQDYFAGIFMLTKCQYARVTGGSDFALTPMVNVAATTFESGFLATLTAKARSRDAAVGAFRLPTEAQWENLERCGTLTQFEFANKEEAQTDRYYSTTLFHVYGRLSQTNARFGGNSNPCEVGLFLPNRWGLYDTYGNAYEMCCEKMGDYTQGPEGTLASPLVNPTGGVDPENPDKRVCRSCDPYAGDFYGCNSATRADNANLGRTGYRISLTLP